MIAPPLAISVLAGVGLYAAWSDARYRRLSNALVAVSALCGLTLAIAAGGVAASGSNLLHGAVALLFGLPLFAWRLMGGGDVKFYASVAAWFPLDQGFRLLAFVSLAGMLLAAGWLAWRWTLGSTDRSSETAQAEKVPFGIAITCGGLLTALAWPQ